MQSITVEKSTLRETLVANRDTHVKDFEIAWEAYHKSVITKAEKILAKAKSADVGDSVDIYSELDAPRNHSSDYNRAIEMIDFDINDAVELSEADFKTLIQDNWQWKTKFSHDNTFYTGSASPSTVIS